MVTEVNEAEFRQNAGDLLERVQASHGSVLIRENGEPVAALVDVESYNRMLWQRIDEAAAPLRKAYADVPEEELNAELEQIIADMRRR